MCLSTVYKDSMVPDAILMKNVMKIECRDGEVVLTDLMDRSMTVPGSLQQANLVEGFVIIKTA
ncbi:MAG: CooT family nickel-binding protein [Oscillospiraceae bacterium]|nr:CooT family nickel-binding protein [Oscillospiraceae bacterium]